MAGNNHRVAIWIMSSNLINLSNLSLCTYAQTQVICLFSYLM